MNFIVPTYVLSLDLKITTILGNGAEFLASPNFNLPLINLISALPYMYS